MFMKHYFWTFFVLTVWFANVFQVNRKVMSSNQNHSACFSHNYINSVCILLHEQRRKPAVVIQILQLQFLVLTSLDEKSEFSLWCWLMDWSSLIYSNGLHSVSMELNSFGLSARISHICLKSPPVPVEALLPKQRSHRFCNGPPHGCLTSVILQIASTRWNRTAVRKDGKLCASNACHYLS